MAQSLTAGANSCMQAPQVQYKHIIVKAYTVHANARRKGQRTPVPASKADLASAMASLKASGFVAPLPT